MGNGGRDEPVVLEEAEADADEREHEVQAEEVAVGELDAPSGEAQPNDARLGGQASDERQRGEVKRDVQQVVRRDRECNDERLADLTQKNVGSQVQYVGRAEARTDLDAVDAREDVDAVGAEG